MKMIDRIEVDPGVCHGQACINGTRIPVSPTRKRIPLAPIRALS